MARDEKSLRDAMEQSASILTAAGFPKMPARVLMALTVEDDDGMTAQELAEQLSVSPAAISGAVRYLQTIGYVRRTAQRGSRRDRYELPADMWYGAALSQTPVYDMIASLLDTAVEAIDDPTSAASQRADEMARFYRFVGARMPALLEEWKALSEQVKDPHPLVSKVGAASP